MNLCLKKKFNLIQIHHEQQYFINIHYNLHETSQPPPAQHDSGIFQSKSSSHYVGSHIQSIHCKLKRHE